ncbi:23S rRNA (uracil(1939)-C(5))-methyltransferase RlmD [candidate division KSB1 bacterium]|nr:23S rRNA (uracil(1939)-C(5))-methyltransferase RlmD [candidate division KSB1 bacterium]
MNIPVTRGQELTITIEGLAFSGKSFARLDDFMIFVERALPGQQVLVRVTKKRAHYAEARRLQILMPSPLEITPPCPHFGLNNCGGCLWQNLNYRSQLQFKQIQVQDCLQHIGGLENFSVQPIMPAPEIYFYRNKMEFSFGEKPWYPASNPPPAQRPPLALGLHVPGHFDRIVDIENCQLLSPVSNQILTFIRNFALASGLEAWRTRDYLGFWRNVVFRQAKTTGELMVNLVTAALPEHYPVVRQLAQQLQTNFAAITTIVHNICRKKAQVTTGDEEFILMGAGKLRERIGQFTFEISANSFFQTNTQQAEKLYQQILQLSEVNGAEVVYDFYCGTGTIAIYLAPYVREVLGFEIIPAAIQNARLNCEANGVTNCRFIEGDLKDQLKLQLQTDPTFPTPDVIVVDPPRAGLHPQVIQQILALQPPKIIYVSCNPATLARDLKSLLEGESRYTLRCVQPIDLFPHTAHCETIAQLTRV